MLASQFEPGHARKTFYCDVSGVSLIISVSRRGDDVMICSMRPLEDLAFSAWSSHWFATMVDEC